MTRTEFLPDAAPPTPWMAGVAYGMALLASGWILGPLRVLLVAPWTGPFAAVFLEAPLMIAVMVLTVRWMGRLNWIGSRPRDRAAMGLIGAGLVLAGEGAGALLMNDGGETLNGLNAFVTPAGLVGLVLVGVAALAPLLLLAWPSPRLR